MFCAISVISQASQTIAEELRPGALLYTGTIVSQSTVSRFFNHGFAIKGCLCKANFVPYDKFRPANIEKAVQYLRYLVQFDPRRVKYADEKSIKGRAIDNK